MKYKKEHKLIIVCIIFVLLVLLVCMCQGIYICCGFRDFDKTTEEWIEQLFYISNVEYEVVEENNELDPREYGGGYRVELKVAKENASDFISKIEENYYIPEDIEYYQNPIVNVYGQELGEGDTFYYSMGAVRRDIKWESMVPKTCSFFIICSKKENGELYVIMEYAE